ncbi:MAG: nucleotidyltransferase family protein [Thermodesulfobacteriota bacterium]|nr:nucleotidyltransferase family protein [Thermodesulfobacteriota bacterium]
MKIPWSDKELEIVRCCAGLAVADCFVRDLRAGIEDGPGDWPKVLALAGQHGLAGFVYKALANHGKDLVPEAVLAQLKKMYFQNSTRNLYLGATLRRDDPGLAQGIYQGKGTEMLPHGAAGAGPGPALFCR